MGFLDRAIRRGISQGIGDAVGKAVRQAIEPTATELADKAARHLENATQNAAQSVQNQTQYTRQADGLQGAFANLERAAQDYATQVSKNIKQCPSCGETAGVEKKFCPSCGAELPEQSVAQGAVCPSCGKQNAVGTKFCEDCGTKLPAAVQAEQMQQQKDAAVLAQWNELLAAYPQWTCGGTQLHIEDYDNWFAFSARFSDYRSGEIAVRQYREILKQNGFHPAGQYPNEEHLYKKINGVCYHVDTEHCFEGDSDCPQIGFDCSEPTGGYDYVKPEPKKNASWKDLFNL